LTIEGQIGINETIETGHCPGSCRGYLATEYRDFIPIDTDKIISLIQS
jgi:hypothetical protein